MYKLGLVITQVSYYSSYTPIQPRCFRPKPKVPPKNLGDLNDD